MKPYWVCYVLGWLFAIPFLFLIGGDSSREAYLWSMGSMMVTVVLWGLGWVFKTKELRG